MKIYKTEGNIIIESDQLCYEITGTSWDDLINRDDLFNHLQEMVGRLSPAGNADLLLTQKILPPIQNQEIWAAGVTYLRSKTARMEESKESGAASFYDKVYEAERPELLFKATAHRAVGHNDYVNIRKDSTWDVPEPELTLLITSSGKVVGYTIGNDMSSRSIEGENPLYLPQAKCYNRCAGLGPCIFVQQDVISPDTKIAMKILRNGNPVFEGNTLISQMKRSHEELAGFLFREMGFPYGVFLMTGTCVVPDNDFTLRSADEIQISIDNIGTLINIVS